MKKIIFVEDLNVNIYCDISKSGINTFDGRISHVTIGIKNS